MKTFEQYLILIGIRSLDYKYTDDELFENIEYFKKCMEHGMSAYKALLFLDEHIKGNYEFN